MAGARARRDRRGDQRRPPADRGRRHRALPARAREGLGAGPGDPRGDQARGDRASSGARRRRRFASGWRGSIRQPRSGCLPATDSGSIRAFEVVRATGSADRDLAAAAESATRLPLRDDPARAAARAALRRLRRPLRSDDRGRRARPRRRRSPRRGLDPEPAGDEGGRPARTPVAICAARSRSTTAIAAAQRATRRYAKRQMTWFRHQMTPDLVLDAQFSESLLRCSRHFIDQFLLTALGLADYVAPPPWGANSSAARASCARYCCRRRLSCRPSR